MANLAEDPNTRIGQNSQVDCSVGPKTPAFDEVMPEQEPTDSSQKKEQEDNDHKEGIS
jgi:hypothetical protein